MVRYDEYAENRVFLTVMLRGASLVPKEQEETADFGHLEEDMESLFEGLGIFDDNCELDIEVDDPEFVSVEGRTSVLVSDTNEITAFTRDDKVVEDKIAKELLCYCKAHGYAEEGASVRVDISFDTKEIRQEEPAYEFVD